MARITKVELEQQLIASQRDNAALRERISILEAEVARLSALAVDAAQTLQSGDEQAQADAAQRVYREAKTADWPTAPVAPKAKRQLPAHFIAAREAAMRLGRCIKVEVSHA